MKFSVHDSLIWQQNLIKFGAIKLILIRKLFKSNCRQNFGVKVTSEESLGA